MNLGFHKQVPRDGIIWKVQQEVTSSVKWRKGTKTRKLVQTNIIQ